MDNRGQITEIKIKINETNFTITAIYGPTGHNKDQTMGQIDDILSNKIKPHENNILIDDFNAIPEGKDAIKKIHPIQNIKKKNLIHNFSPQSIKMC